MSVEECPRGAENHDHFDDGEWHNERPTEFGKPFIPMTSWTPQWQPEPEEDNAADLAMPDAKNPPFKT